MATKFVRVPIEIDITCVNKTWFSLKTKKNVSYYVIGLYQRHGQAIVEPLEDNNPETIAEAIFKYAEKGSIVYAEEKLLPASVREFYEIYELKDGERSNGDIHVNNVKSIWKSLKRVIKQTHIHVSKKHLSLYCGEVVWRVNNRHLSPSDKFNLVLASAAVGIGKKSTYKNLIK